MIFFSIRNRRKSETDQGFDIRESREADTGFALPVLTGNMLQQFYNLVDSLIIGQLLGVTALTAVSASGWLDWAVLSIPMGLAQGYSIHASQCYGGKQYAELKRTVAQSYLISAAVTVALEAISQTLLRPVLTWMNSPEETIHLTENYLRIIYAGLPVVMCLNMFSGFLYALGNSRTPLLALVCATAVNIALDWWFVGSLGLGTNGGAYATVIAQAVSAGICLAAVLKIPELRPQRVDYRPDRIVIQKLVRLGFPIAFQNLIISLEGSYCKAWSTPSDSSLWPGTTRPPGCRTGGNRRIFPGERGGYLYRAELWRRKNGSCKAGAAAFSTDRFSARAYRRRADDSIRKVHSFPVYPG